MIYNTMQMGTVACLLLAVSGCQSAPDDEDQAASATLLRPIFTERAPIEEQPLAGTGTESVGLSPSLGPTSDFADPVKAGKNFRRGGP